MSFSSSLVNIVAFFQSNHASSHFNQIKQDLVMEGANINIHEGRACCDPALPQHGQHDDKDCFSGHRCMSHLKSTSLGHLLLVTPEITSTQDFIRQNSSRLGSGVVMVADKQSSGKGRGGNSWTSPKGCLMMSAISRLAIPGAWAPFINYVVSLAVVQGVEDAVKVVEPRLPTSSLGIRIKWPNDIYSTAGLKLGGILIHTTWSSDSFNVVTGIGLNVTNGQPTTCLMELLESCLINREKDYAVVGTTGSTSSSSGQYVQDAADGAAAAAASPRDDVKGSALLRFDRELLTACILNQLERCFMTFEAKGFEPLKEAYLSAWLHSEQQIVAYDPDTIAPVKSSSGLLSPDLGVQLTIKGLSQSGFLLAEDMYGCQHELTPDGNSLDMMRNLIKRKIT
ncbi:hypothetical protein CEUSTIGMA_g3268.t1 [Chlamydomonas eustigma]|uniref:BPL/LPL catalytic domain-containing protein n=1 Tax=Chlamydomonas eustigma TaxID=1157962 RepID=A0A250WYG6_9CHLO|nr:hypothetical protein CEUSTIGMA_g3268.t1 [Chlamydomonas eustigma]|eukprot:GAX75825.1 hypothetical protein CEUSTIGMA_g3268.t1 [Chlamydomonas eustigma]